MFDFAHVSQHTDLPMEHKANFSPFSPILVFPTFQFLQLQLLTLMETSSVSPVLHIRLKYLFIIGLGVTVCGELFPNPQPNIPYGQQTRENSLQIENGFKV